MKRSTPLIALAVVACVALLALSLYLHSWGGVTLIALGAAGVAWYRMQVARGEAAEQFFGDLGEETRLTGFQGGPGSELPPEHARPGAAPNEPPR
jgi:hypothetical protein